VHVLLLMLLLLAWRLAKKGQSGSRRLCRHKRALGQVFLYGDPTPGSGWHATEGQSEDHHPNVKEIV